MPFYWDAFISKYEDCHKWETALLLQAFYYYLNDKNNLDEVIERARKEVS